MVLVLSSTKGIVRSISETEHGRVRSMKVLKNTPLHRVSHHDEMMMMMCLIT